MKKLTFLFAAFLAVALAGSSTPAHACDGHKKAKTAAGKQKAKPQVVVLTGKVVSYGCPMDAAKEGCTGAALAVGESRHPIKNKEKGGALTAEAKDTDKLVEVKANESAGYLIVKDYSIKS